MIFYTTPYCKGNIGKGINDTIDLLPDDTWICIRDLDTLPLTETFGDQVQSVVDANDDYDLIGCLTNRIRAPYQLFGGTISDNPDISYHKAIADQLWRDNGSEVLPVQNVVAGMFMLFPKKTWSNNHFKEHSIFFDQSFSNSILRAGGKIGIAQGLYIFHMYRWGHSDPSNYTKHLK